MSNRMLKYRLDFGYSQQIDVLMREGAVIRKAGMQDQVIHLWAETPVESHSITVTRTFRVIPTGVDVPDGTYLDTVFDYSFVWHVYEVTS